MKTWKGICLEEHTITDKEGTSFTLERGKEYDLGAEIEGQRMVFSRYWVTVPSELFGGIQPGYGHGNKV